MTKECSKWINIQFLLVYQSQNPLKNRESEKTTKDVAKHVQTSCGGSEHHLKENTLKNSSKIEHKPSIT